MAEDFIADIIGTEAPKSTVEQPKTETPDVTIGALAPPDGAAKEDKSNLAEAAEAAEVKELAKQLGWREDHTGDDAVDAKTYILRSKDIQKSMSQHWVVLLRH